MQGKSVEKPINRTEARNVSYSSRTHSNSRSNKINIFSRARFSLKSSGCSYPPLRPFFSCSGCNAENCALDATKKFIGKNSSDIAIESINLMQARKDVNKLQAFISGTGAAIGFGMMAAILLGSVTFGVGTAVILAVGICCAVAMGISGLYKQSQDPAALVHISCTPAEMLIKQLKPQNKENHQKNRPISHQVSVSNHSTDFNINQSTDNLDQEDLRLSLLKFSSDILMGYLAKKEISKNRKWYIPSDWRNGSHYLNFENFDKTRRDFIQTLHGQDPIQNNLKDYLALNKALIKILGGKTQGISIMRPFQTALVTTMTAIRFPGIQHCIEPFLHSISAMPFASPVLSATSFFAAGVEFSKPWITKHRTLNLYADMISYLETYSDLSLTIGQKDRINRLLLAH